MLRLDKIAVITGCNRGVGKGIKDVLIKNGYYVYGLNKTITSNSDNYREIKCDVSNYDEVISVFKNIKKIDLLVINAGIRRFNSIEQLNVSDFKDSLDVNLLGAFNVVKAAIKLVKENKGDIFFVGSHSEKYSFGEGSAYCASKGGLRHFSECLMDEVRYNDVRVTYLSLGSIKNRNHNIYEEWKLMPEDVGYTIVNFVNLPKKIMIPYADVRPIKPLKNELKGIEKLQYV